MGREAWHTPTLPLIENQGTEFWLRRWLARPNQVGEQLNGCRGRLGLEPLTDVRPWAHLAHLHATCTDRFRPTSGPCSNLFEWLDGLEVRPAWGFDATSQTPPWLVMRHERDEAGGPFEVQLHRR